MNGWRYPRLGFFSMLAICPCVGIGSFIPENQRLRSLVTIQVSPDGDDGGNGSAAHPYRSLARAQRAVRAANQSSDVEVILAGGWYRLDEPLRFAAADGGQAGTTVTWRGADGELPVIAGSFAVTGWRLHDAQRQIYVADIPVGTDARQLWVNDKLANLAVIELERARVTFDGEGIVIDDPRFAFLADVPDKRRIEVHSTGWFTSRISPVRDVVGQKLLMQQPAWDNNTWGYDTLHAPVGAETSHLYLANSLSFVRESLQFYVDPRAGRLYLRPEPGTDIAAMRVEVPRLQYLLSIGGSHEQPLRDLTFQGIRFSYTSWMGPSSGEGYADQQSGAFLKGMSPERPRDAIRTCVWGCREFETRRNDWSQMPAAVQVSAAERVTFDHDVFAHLGQIALGIGNNPDAHANGVGLGARSILVRRSVFTDLAGGAILAGGICRDAHHPADPRTADRDVTIIDNRIETVSQVYRDNSAILSTYVDSVLVLHNDISDAPYDGIDIGWGWGVNDVGGNPVYRDARRGYYDHPQNLTYDTPTLQRRARVAYNHIHHIKKLFHDGGAIYNLSASPGTVIAENYIHDIPGRIGLYLDEGSRYVTVRNNVVDGAGVWLNVNTLGDFWPLRVSTDNLAVGNWFSTGKVTGSWDEYYDNRLEANQHVKTGQWPEAARRVIENSGIEKSAGAVAYAPTR